MKKSSIIISLLINTILLQAQEKSLVADIFPAAPTSNNLMKFEEVPVSYYTGIPNINIPLFNESTNVPNLGMSITLDYHPYNAKPKDKASEVGLGWSLIAGGTITRTINGIPDEGDFTSASLGGQKGIGIYFDNFSNNVNDNNFTSKLLSIWENQDNTENYFNQINKLFYEAHFFNKYDTKYDLYQYNFLGKTGRFIVKKRKDNTFYVEKLDNNNLIIEPDFNSTSYKPNSFVIIDDNGIKYIFDIKESTKIKNFTNRSGFDGSENSSESFVSNTTSSFHISEIKYNENSIVKFNYKEVEDLFYTDISKIERTTDESIPLDDFKIHKGLIPSKQELNVKNYTVSTKLIDNIEIVNKGKYIFEFTEGRKDDNYGKYKLTAIFKKDLNNNLIEKYNFLYDYFTFSLNTNFENSKRLKLNIINHYGNNDNLIGKYEFNYYNNNKTTYGIDKWGWANCNKSNRDLEADENCITQNIIKTITLPTGGIQFFDFGTNTYSFDHKGEEMPPIYEEITKELGYHYLDKTNIKTGKNLFTLDTESDIYFNIEAYGLDNIPWQIILSKDGIITNYTIGNSAGDSKFNTTPRLILPAGNYTAKLQITQPGFNYTNQVNLSIETKSNELSSKKHKNGGGIRINTIKYYNNLSDYNLSKPLKNIKYDYQSSVKKIYSSGFLANPEPINSYTQNIRGRDKYLREFNHNFLVYSYDNLLPVNKTKGSDIGYEEISIKEINNGQTSERKLVFTSSKDYPNYSQQNSMPPFLPIYNNDYKLGNLAEESYYSNQEKLREIKNKYNFILEKNKVIGIDVYFNPINNYQYTNPLKSYELYISTCNSNPNEYMCYNGYSNPSSFLSGSEVFEKFGNTIKIGETEYNDFENHTLEVSKNYKYESVNPLLLSKSEIINSKGDTISTEYQYPQDIPSYPHMDKLIAQNRIAEPVITKQKVGDNYVSATYNEYNVFNNIAQKARIFQKKGDSNFTDNDVVLKYDSYDTQGNITQYTLTNGIPITIIWGYNGQYPIAKIEGASLSEVNSFINALQTASNNGSLTKDSFNSLRSSFTNTMITSYTYQPLVGVTSITAPNGQTEFYNYDASNRLQSIVNDKGEVLKSFQYNYKH